MIDRIDSEREFHDRQAADRATRFRDLASLRLRGADYLDHETWIRPAMAMLGPVAGKSVLDVGCGHGMASVVLARQGATVTGIDLSSGYVEESKRRSLANETDGTFLVANAERLPFADASFDAIWGSAILHHLDLAAAGRELRRVLKPGGVAVFCEPWGGNPLLGFARRCLPYPGKHRTPDERPLCRRDLDPLREMFSAVEVHGFQLIGMLRRGITRQTRRSWIDRFDESLLRRLPSLGNWCRYAVVSIR